MSERRFSSVIVASAVSALWMLGAAVGFAQTPLRIAAAADLAPVLPDVLAAWEKQTGLHAEASFQSSATLAQQITSGSPVDVFFSADTGFAQRVIDAGLALEATPVIYARGTLVLWARKDAPVLHGKTLTLDTLHAPDLQSVAIANAEHAPYGRAAQEAMAAMGLTAALAPKLRIAANIAQTAQYADSGNAEVGFLSLTGARTQKLQDDGTYVVVPANSYKPIQQGAVILKRGDAKAAESLLQFLKTPAMRALLQSKGLEAPQ